MCTREAHKQAAESRAGSPFPPKASWRLGSSPTWGWGEKKTLHTSTFKTKHNGGGRGEEAVCALGRHIKAGSRRPGWFTLPPKASWRLGSSITWGWRKQCTREAHRGPTQSVETRELHLIPKRNLEKKKKKHRDGKGRAPGGKSHHPNCTGDNHEAGTPDTPRRLG